MDNKEKAEELRKRGILPEDAELSEISKYCDRKCSKCLQLTLQKRFFFLLIICSVLREEAK